MRTLTKIFEFDSAHRVMNERVKCFNLHGHRFKLEVTFSYCEVSELGYAIDFKEINRVVGNFINTYFDHGCILNPEDKDIINLCTKNNWKVWIMGMGSEDYTNPSAENIANELLTIFKCMFTHTNRNVEVSKLRLYETPTCYVETTQVTGFMTQDFVDFITNEADKAGVVEYDDRKIKK